MSARASVLTPRVSKGGRDLRVVRRRSRRLVTRSPGTRIAPFAIVAAIGVAAIIATVLLEQVMLAQSAFHLSDLRTELQEAEAKHEELLLESATLDSATRIERYARETLGMIDPPPGSVRYIVADIDRGGRARVRPGPRNGPPSSGGIAAGSPFTLPAEGASP